MDLHSDIHAMATAYMDPYEFRRALNSAIQTARSVTFLLQKRKAKLPDFDSWYAEWVESSKLAPEMTWAIASRNRIVKEEDLSINSFLRIELRSSWTAGVDIEDELDPRISAREIAGQLREKFEGRSLAGVLTVRREWRDSELPDQELIDGLSKVYARLANIVRLAHLSLGQTSCDPGDRSRRECIRPDHLGEIICLDGKKFSRASIDLSDWSLLDFESRLVERDDAVIATLGEKYGVASLPAGVPTELVLPILEMGGRVLVVDEYHLPIAFLYKGDNVVYVTSPVSSNKREQMFHIEELSRKAKSLDADGVLYISEAWSGTLADMQTETGPKPLSTSSFYDSDRFGRSEVLAASALEKNGRARFAERAFSRHPDGIQLAAVAEINLHGTIPNFLLPFARAWGLSPSFLSKSST